MQSACLLSDMEAFKAANPGCVLGDFVRWYSPRDWIEDTVVNDDGTAQHTGCSLAVFLIFHIILIVHIILIFHIIVINLIIVLIIRWFLLS